MHFQEEYHIRLNVKYLEDWRVLIVRILDRERVPGQDVLAFAKPADRGGKEGEEDDSRGSV
jgi:hypothetical protein